MHWVYVIKSSQTGAIYVGETTRLYRRWNEHMTGNGGLTTSQDDYDTLIGLYRVAHNWSFLTYYSEMMNGVYSYQCAKYWNEEPDKSEACEVENHITQRFRLEYKSKNWWDIQGGKYCGRNSTSLNLTNIVIDRPLCKCGYPCEVKIKNDETKIYFVCPIPTWIDTGIDIPNPCNFWEEFKPYRELREKHISQRQKKRLDSWIIMTNEEFTT